MVRLLQLDKLQHVTMVNVAVRKPLQIPGHVLVLLEQKGLLG